MALSLNAAAEVFREAMRDTIKRCSLWRFGRAIMLWRASAYATIDELVSRQVLTRSTVEPDQRPDHSELTSIQQVRRSVRRGLAVRSGHASALAQPDHVGPGAVFMVLYPITSQPPGPDRAAIELPAIEKRRLGLTDAPRSWIILDETNGDELPTSPHFERVAGAPDHPFVYGELSRAFLKQFAQAALAVTRRIAVPRIPRG